MTKPNPAAEPSMEEILASIRRIIADGDEPAAAGPQAGRPTLRPAAVPPAMPQAQQEKDEEEEEFEGDADDEDILDLTEEMFAGPPEEDAPQAVDEPGTDEVADRAEPRRAISEMPIVEPRNNEVVFADTASAVPEPEAEEAAPSRQASSVGDETPIGPRTAPGAKSADAGTQSSPSPRDGDAAERDRMMSPSTDATVAAAFGRLADTMLSSDSRTLEDIVKDMLRPMLKEWLDDNLPTLVERLVRAEIERVSRGRS